MKKIAVILVNLLFIIVFSSCGPSEEMKQEAEDRLNLYKPAFEEKVETEYGKQAELKNVKCPVLTKVGSPVPDVTYKISDTLNGDIVISGEKYRGIYYPDSDILIDTVHTEAICDEILEMVPIDKDKIKRTKYTDSSFSTPSFDSRVVSVSEAKKYGASGGMIFISVLTMEDLSKYNENDFKSVPGLLDLWEGDGNLGCQIKIVSLKNTDRIDALYGKIQEMHFSYSESHPKVYIDSNSYDSFDYYNIRNTIQLEGDSGKMKMVYTE